MIIYRRGHPAATSSGTVFTAPARLISDQGWPGYTAVIILPADVLAPAVGTQVRVTLEFLAFSAGATAAAYMAQQATVGDVYDFANTPSHITFSGGDITGDGTTLTWVSDWVNLPEAYDESKAYIVSAQFGVTPLVDLSYDGPGSNVFYLHVATEAALVDKSGYNNNNANSEFVTKVEIR